MRPLTAHHKKPSTLHTTPIAIKEVLSSTRPVKKYNPPQAAVQPVSEEYPSVRGRLGHRDDITAIIPEMTKPKYQRLPGRTFSEACPRRVSGDVAKSTPMDM